jgi:hypothetical protein
MSPYKNSNRNFKFYILTFEVHKLIISISQSRVKSSGVTDPALPQTSSLTLGKPLNCSIPQHLHLSSQMKIICSA